MCYVCLVHIVHLLHQYINHTIIVHILFIVWTGAEAQRILGAAKIAEESKFLHKKDLHELTSSQKYVTYKWSKMVQVVN